MQSKFEHYRSGAITAAKDFEYGSEVIKRIKKAATEKEIINIMKEARHRKWD